MALGDWRVATKRIRHEHETKGEVVEFHAFPIDTRAQSCREAMLRLESAINEVAHAILVHDEAQAAFARAVEAAGTGTVCEPHRVQVSRLTVVIEERLEQLKKNAE